MGFMMEFAENFIRDRMVTYDERVQQLRTEVERAEEAKRKNKRNWTQPTHPYGYWNSIKFNRVYYHRLEESNWRGKQDPYDLIKPDPFAGLERPYWEF